MAPANPIGTALSVLTRIGASDTLDKLKMRKALEKLVYSGTRTGFQSISAAARQFKPMVKLLKPARMDRPQTPDLFDLTLTEEQAIFRDTVHRLVNDVVIPAADAADEASQASAELLQQVHELGDAWMAIPEPVGGAGTERSPVLHMLLAEELGRGDMGVALAAMAPIGVLNALAEWGSAEQQSKYMPAFAEEQFHAASVAVNEARALFDPFQLQTTARRNAGGFELTGHKALVPLAGQCELFLVAAELEGHGSQLFLVEASAEGVSFRPEPAMGTRAAATARLALDHVQLPASAWLGMGETGFDYARFIALSRIGWAAAVTGCCQSVLDYVIPYVKERVAFGEPIAFRQSVAFMVANIGIELEGLRLLVYRAASRAEQGRSFEREAYIAALQAADKGMEIGTNGVQLLGGHGYTKEHPVERWYRNLRAAGIQYNGIMV